MLTDSDRYQIIAIRILVTPNVYSRRERYGLANEHNGWAPREFWLEDWEKQKQATIAFHRKNPLEGCGRLTFRMLDAGKPRDHIAMAVVNAPHLPPGARDTALEDSPRL